MFCFVLFTSNLRVESVNSSFHLCRHGPLLELQLAGVHHGPARQTLAETQEKAAHGNLFTTLTKTWVEVQSNNKLINN